MPGSEFEREIASLVARHWMIVGHESELPQPGNFVVRNVGLDTVIMVRGLNGSIRVLRNNCPHEDVPLFRRNEAGRAARFVCRWHGWVFEHDGRLRRSLLAPDIADAAANDTTDLQSVPSASRAGIVFATWAVSPPPLDDCFGAEGASVWHTAAPLIATDPPRRLAVDAEWTRVMDLLTAQPMVARALPTGAAAVHESADGTWLELISVVPRRVDRSELVRVVLHDRDCRVDPGYDGVVDLVAKAVAALARRTSRTDFVASV